MKRFISILLAAMLVISMLPTAFADSTTVYEYKFSKTALPEIGIDGNPSPAQLKALTDYPTMGAGSQKWRLIDYGSKVGGNLTADSKYDGRLMITATAANISNNNQVWAIIKINVPTAGIYNFDVYAANQAAAAGVDVYLFPCGDITSPNLATLNSQTVKGHFDAVDSTANGNIFTERDMGDIYIEADGEYYVGFNLTHNGVTTGTTKENAYISKVTLTETPASALSVSPTSVSIKAGNTAQITSSVTDAAGAELSVAKITYTSSATGVATVDANGLITGVSAGDATITATVAGYPSLTQTVTVKVSPATVKNNYNYVFTTGASGIANGTSPANLVTQSTEGAYYTTYTETNKWMMYAVRGSYPGGLFATYLQVGRKGVLPQGNNVDNGFIMKLEVPESGIYTPSIGFIKDDLGLQLNMYLVDTDNMSITFNNKGGVDTAIDNVKNTDYYIGTIDTYTGSDDTTGKELKTVYLNSGDYYLIYEMVGYDSAISTDSSSTTTYVSKITNFTLSETPADSITVAPASVSLETGKKETIVPTVKDEDGKVLSGAAVEYVSGDNDVAKVDANGVITGGTKTGSTTITATVKGYPKVKATVNVSNTYKDNGSLGKAVKYEFNTSFMTSDAEDSAKKAYEENDGKGYKDGVLYYDLSFVDEDSEFTAGWLFNNSNVAYHHLAKTRLNISLDPEKYDEGQFFAAKIDVPNKGWYTLSIDTIGRPHGSAADIYVLPVGNIDKVTPAACSVEDRIGHINLYAADDRTTYTDKAIGNVEFEDAGEYYVVFSFNSTNPNTYDTEGTQYFWIDNLHLTGLGLENPKAEAAVSTTETTVSFSLNCAVEDAVTVTGIDGYEIGQVNGSVPFGKSITLTAENEIDGATFAGWYRGADVNDDSSFVSDAATFTFNAYTSFYLTAKYVAEEETDGDTVKVEFYKENGDLVGVETVAKGVSGEDIIPADVPTLIGYNFDNWYVDGSTLLKSVAEINKLTRAVALFNAKATGSAKVNYVDSGMTAYNSKITKSVSGAKYWLRDGNVVGYGSNYTHYLWADTDITYSVAAIENKPVIYLDDDIVDGACMIEYDKGNADAIVEVGILFGGSENINIASKSKMNASQKNYDHGQLAVAHDGNAYARGYMIYVDGGVYNVIYTDAMSVQ
ncbi:MAG: Ig-like domain-containing protein [Oscillospiraceae bacterium]|nr:Ig-like domain-containing protein [Oscillospiraceae bacterium]